MTPTHLEAEARFLTEGAPTYVAAVNAIVAFREIIKRRCRQVVQSRLKEYSKALRWDLDPNGIIDRETTPGEWSGEEGAVGNCIKLENIGSLHHVVYMTTNETGFASVCAYLVSTRKKTEQFWELLKPHVAGLEKFTYSIWLGEELSRDEVGHFEEKLDKVLTRWIEIWKRVGGLKRLSSGTTDSDE